jgi:outer membrane lipoprotein-sorting protein
METKRVNNGKLFTVNADIYYKINEGVMVTHYTYPNEYIFFSNRKGEAKIYYPKKNQVSIQQNELFSSENTLLYYFITNHSVDMGLKELGFTIQDTRFENEFMINTFLPPVQMANKISKIEIVYEEYQPIYTAYFDKSGKINKKIYYSDYSVFEQYSIPLRVTEISFNSSTDSIVSRMIYSDVKIGTNTNSAYFDYTIPKNAKLIK